MRTQSIGNREKTDASRVQVRQFTNLGHFLGGAVAIAAAIATTTQSNLTQLLERQVQTLFFELRGTVAPPAQIVILALDENSLVQGRQIYPSNPQKYAYLEPLTTFPPKRQAYAVAIDRLLAAGAKTVALDVVLDAPSSNGDKDDLALQQALQKYPGKVTLAALYEDTNNQTDREGDLSQLTLPHPTFLAAAPATGFINYPTAPDGRIYMLGSQYPLQVAQSYGADLQPLVQEWLQQNAQTPAFAEAVLRSAQISYAKPKGENIFFYGAMGTFEQISFWQVLDPTSWERHQKNGKFKDKIVLIGPTAQISRDFHAAPFSKTLAHPNPMTGVEVNANAIATLLQNRAIAQAFPTPIAQGVFALVIVLAAGVAQGRLKRPTLRFLLSVGLAIALGSVSYGFFVQGQLILPTAIPILAIVATGSAYLVTGSASDYLRKRQLRQTLEHYAASPIVQEIISQQDDLQDLLREREQAIFGKTLAGRYKIIKVLGAGGFGETYVAEDTQRPGSPSCVVKQLRPASNDLKLLQLARRLFNREAETLEKLGNHDQIPQLLAYFEEENEFYLVQEYIPGKLLSQELSLGKQWSEAAVIALLQELLQILEFVHSQGVIHRDIKPSNIILREHDRKPVLIDFGAVKEIHQLAEHWEQTSLTIGIGTQGYMPNEQCAGNPRFNSDLYAVGMTAIQALTGLPPKQLKADLHTGEILWRHRSRVSHGLATVLGQMVRYDFTRRHQSATEVLEALTHLAVTEVPALPPVEISTNSSFVDSDTAIAAPTTPWLETAATPSDLPTTNVPIDR